MLPDVNLYQTAEAGITIRDNKQEIMLKYFIFVLEKDEEQKRDWPAYEILILITRVSQPFKPLCTYTVKPA